MIDPVEVIDIQLDLILKYPGMWGASTPMGLESLVVTLLGLRSNWMPSSKKRGRDIYRKLIFDHFGEGGPLTAASRFDLKYGNHDLYHWSKEAWQEVVEFYTELTHRERVAAGGVFEIETIPECPWCWEHTAAAISGEPDWWRCPCGKEFGCGTP